MKTPDKSLVGFYFGSLPDERRRLVEKDMLEDPEVLLDYLDLKRVIEGAPQVPQEPSALLWKKLSRVSKKKKKWYLGLALGTAAAAILGFYLFTRTKVDLLTGSEAPILFDSGAEHSPVSDVL